MMPPRAIDNGEWTTLALALNTSSAQAADAARRKSVDDLLEAGSAMYDACTACHEAYIPDQQP
jgi:cytochrome c556